LTLTLTPNPNQVIVRNSSGHVISESGDDPDTESSRILAEANHPVEGRALSEAPGVVSIEVVINIPAGVSEDAVMAVVMREMADPQKATALLGFAVSDLVAFIGAPPASPPFPPWPLPPSPAPPPASPPPEEINPKAIIVTACSRMFMYARGPRAGRGSAPPV
jgi:hypothetical protein